MWILDTNAMIKISKQYQSYKIKKNYTFTTIFNVIEYPPAIKYIDLTILYPKLIHYENAFLLATKLREEGIGQAAIDILTAIIAIDHQKTIVTDDHDFQSIQSAESRLKVISLGEYLDFIKKIKSE